jgi:hypothetical protein
LSGSMNQSGSGVWEGGCSRKQGMRYKVAQAPHQNLSEWITPTPPCHIKEREKERERERERERSHLLACFIGLAYQSKDIVFRFIIEYSSLRDFSL